MVLYILIGFYINNQLMSSEEHLYKILMVGDIGTGKTSIIKRYVHNIFSTNYKSTIGVDFALKLIEWDDNIKIKLQIWDIAGQERYGNMTRVYYKDAVAAFVVFDVSRLDTFENVRKWKSDIDSKITISAEESIPVILLANKIDSISEDDETLKALFGNMNQFCKDNDFAAWFKVSAKDNQNIDTAHKTLVSLILDNCFVSTDIDSDDTEPNKNLNKKKTNVIDLDTYSEKSICCNY